MSELPEFKQAFKVDVGQRKQLLLQAIELNPDSIPVLIDLVNISLQENNTTAAKKYLEHLLSLSNIDLKSLVKIASIQFRIGAYQESIKIVDRVLENSPDNIAALILKAKSYLSLKRWDDSNSYSLKVLRIHPNHVLANFLMARVAFHNSKFEECIEICHAILQTKPSFVKANELLFNAQSNIDQISESNIIKLKNNIQIFDLAEYSDKGKIVDLNKKINVHLLNSPHWVEDPILNTTKNGAQLKNIFNQSELKHSIVQEIKSLFEKAINSYLDIRKNEGLSYFNTIPKLLTFNAWAVRLHTGGHQDPHTHPSGWVSGVYYTQVPKLNTDQFEGALEFGLKDPKKNFQQYYRVNAKEGNLILFPSYCPHRTIPFSNKEERICISFDVFPYREN